MNRRTLLGGSMASLGIATIGSAARTRTGTAQDTGPQATIDYLQTRVADLKTSVAKRDEKIDRLETAIAQSGQATATPTPADIESMFDIWRIESATGVFLPTIESGEQPDVAAGVFLVASLIVVNTSNMPAEFPMRDLRVVASEGRVYSFDLKATVSYSVYVLDTITSEDLQPDLPTPVTVVFDVPPDSGPYILTDDRDDLNVPIVVS